MPTRQFMNVMLTCADCKHPFLWSAGEQEFYDEHELSEPRRCRDCREKRKRKRRG